MGIIQSQATKGTLVTYLGVLVGFVVSGFLIPKFLSPNEIGAYGLLISYSLIFSTIFSFGIGQVIVILYPKYKTEDNYNKGLASLACILLVLGTIIFCGLFYFLKPWLVSSSSSIQNKELYWESIMYYCIPVTMALMFFTFFDSYYRMMLRSVIGTLAKELILRVFIGISLVAFLLFDLSFQEFILLVCLSYILLVIFMLIYGLKHSLIRFAKPVKIGTKLLASSLFWSVLAAFGYIIVAQIDRIFMDKVYGEYWTGIYTTLFFYSVVVQIPSRAIRKISTSVLSNSWSSNDMDNIDLVYKKTSVTQFIIGAVIFMGVWFNLPLIFSIVGGDYADVYLENRYFMLFLGFGFLVDHIAGANAEIIGTSKRFYYNAILTIVLIGLALVSNIIFSKLYGPLGIAIATMISYLLMNVVRFILLYAWLKIHPLSKELLLSTLCFGLIFIPSFFFTEYAYTTIWSNVLISGLGILLFGLLCLKLNLSSEMNGMFKGLIQRFKT
jgi:O-antigen/teichoic acid export membrane protein